MFAEMELEITGIKRSRESANESTSDKKPRLETEHKRESFAGLRNASFAFLSEELMFHVFRHVPIESLGIMAITSKAMNKLVASYLLSDLYAERAALMLNDFYCDAQQVCRKLGLAIKRATFLYSVPLRLQYLHQFLDKLCDLLPNLEKEHPECVVPFNILKCTGEVLFTFTRGWDDEECSRVFKSFCSKYKITQSLLHFMHDTPGHDVENETFLRRHLRDIFLDPCPTDAERATWLGFLSLGMGTPQLAKLILLLYGPLDDEGQLDWMFAFELRSFEVHTDAYMRLGRMIASLRHIPDWTKQRSLEVLVYMSNVPNCWLLRSFASILLPLSAYDKDVVFDYFSILYKTSRASTASLLMGLVLVISPLYIGHSRARLEESLQSMEDDDDYYVNETLLDNKCAYRFINNIINHPQLSDHRHLIITKMWKTIRDLLNDFAESFILEDDEERASESHEDYLALTEAWRDYMIFAMID